MHIPCPGLILIPIEDIAKKAESDESTKKHKQPFSSKRSDYWLEKSNKSLEHVSVRPQPMHDPIPNRDTTLPLVVSNLIIGP